MIFYDLNQLYHSLVEVIAINKALVAIITIFLTKAINIKNKYL